MRRLARLSAVLCVILLGVSCNADTPTEPPAAEPSAPPTEDPPPPPPQGNTDVSFGASVPAVVRERASHFVGVGGMTPTDAPHGVDAPAGSLIMAVDVEGNAILAGYSAADLTAALDARTSALFIARLFADPTWLVPEADQALEQALSAHPDFPALTDSIASRAARGLTLDATETVVQAFTLAGQLAPRPSSARAGGPAAADAGGRLPSRAKFELYAFMSAHMTDSDRTSGGMVALSNSALIPMSVTAPAGTFTIASVSFCAVCLWGPMPKTVGSFIVAADGPFDVSVRLDRDVMVAQALFDMIGLFFAGV